MDSTISSDYFENQFPRNYTFWIYVILQFFLFLCGSIASEETNEDQVKQNKWTHHPIYSIWTYHTSIQTKLSWIALVFLRLVSGLFFVSIFNWAISSAHTALLLILIPFGATIYAWIIGMFVAQFLKWLENDYQIYLTCLSVEKDLSAHHQALEVFQVNSYRSRGYMYYLVFILFVG